MRRCIHLCCSDINDYYYYFYYYLITKRSKTFLTSHEYSKFICCTRVSRCIEYIYVYTFSKSVYTFPFLVPFFFKFYFWHYTYSSRLVYMTCEKVRVCLSFVRVYCTSSHSLLWRVCVSRYPTRRLCMPNIYYSERKETKE